MLLNGATLLKSSEQIGHCDVEAPSDYLQRDDSNLALACLDVGQMATIDVQMNRHVGLGPLLFLSKPLYPTAQLYEQCVVASGHLSMMGVSCRSRVWHARQRQWEGRERKWKSRCW